MHILANSTRVPHAETLHFYHYCIEIVFAHTAVCCVLRIQRFPRRTIPPSIVSNEVCFRNAIAICVTCESNICKNRTCEVFFFRQILCYLKRSIVSCVHATVAFMLASQ